VVDRIRTIDTAYEEIRKNDPDTAISRNYIRQIVRDGTIPSIRTGNKYLVSMQVLEEYIKSQTTVQH
jgi:excisionase family DNA binding protein